MAPNREAYDFIVVGSGAGGGPLAANLAVAGYHVALLEAGVDAAVPGTPTFFNCSVPGLHARATEDPAISWEFFVRHYGDEKPHPKDTKEDKTGGIFYPRAAALGGCTAHHAMITIYPFNDDWGQIAAMFPGDESWKPERMRGYFERLEDCQYVPRRSPLQVRDPVTRHGQAGWLPVSMPDPTLALGSDPMLVLRGGSQEKAPADKTKGDPNTVDEQLLVILLHAFLASHAQSPMPPADPQLLSDWKRRVAAGIRQLLDIIETAAATDGYAGLDQAKLDRLKADVNAVLQRADTPAAALKEGKTLLQYYAGDPRLLALFGLALARLDPNRWFPHDPDRHGAYNTPASILQGVRVGVRERILAVKALYPDRLDIITGALVTRVIIEKGQAIGVYYVKREDARYEATPGTKVAGPPSAAKLQRLTVRQPRGEVILAGGAFNTPQLLMLSGVGEAKHLRAMGIPEPYINLPGVGQNLQDRYEVTLVSEMAQPFRILDKLKFRAPGELSDRCEDPANQPTSLDDPGLQEWFNHRGVYASNGAVLTIIKKSKQATDGIPDLFIFGLPGYFRGYYRGYSCDIQNGRLPDGTRNEDQSHNRFTWAILKGRTRSRGGMVRLKDNNPLSRPDINFHYFEESFNKDSPDPEAWKKDRDALVEGLQFVKQIMESTALRHDILVPPAKAFADDKESKSNKALEDHVQRESWGHHACGTCQMGKDSDPMAVLDGDFRVRGVKNLRVVDASVFPRIPGFFIISSIYMMSEKASDVIARDQKGGAGNWPEAPKQPGG